MKSRNHWKRSWLSSGNYIVATSSLWSAWTALSCAVICQNGTCIFIIFNVFFWAFGLFSFRTYFDMTMIVYRIWKIKFYSFWQILENSSKVFPKFQFSGHKPDQLRYLDEFSRNRSSSFPGNWPIRVKNWLKGSQSWYKTTLSLCYEMIRNCQWYWYYAYNKCKSKCSIIGCFLYHTNINQIHKKSITGLFSVYDILKV